MTGPESRDAIALKNHSLATSALPAHPSEPEPNSVRVPADGRAGIAPQRRLHPTREEDFARTCSWPEPEDKPQGDGPERGEQQERFGFSAQPARAFRLPTPDRGLASREGPRRTEATRYAVLTAGSTWRREMAHGGKRHRRSRARRLVKRGAAMTQRCASSG